MLTSSNALELSNPAQNSLPLGQDESIEIDRIIEDGLGRVDDKVLMKREGREESLQTEDAFEGLKMESANERVNEEDLSRAGG